MRRRTASACRSTSSRRAARTTRRPSARGCASAASSTATGAARSKKEAEQEAAATRVRRAARQARRRRRGRGRRGRGRLVPELPEVEVVRRGLDRWVAGPHGRRRPRCCTRARPAATRPGAADLARRLARPHDRGGEPARQVPLAAARRPRRRRWSRTSGMSGQLLVQPRRRARRDAPARPRARSPTAAASCASSTSAPSAASRSTTRARRRRRPRARHRSRTSPATRSTRRSTTPRWVRRLRARRTGIKRALLDQTLVSRHRQHLRRRGAVAGAAALGHADRRAPARPRPASCSATRATSWPRRWRRAARRSTRSTSTSTASPATSTGRWRRTARPDRPCPRCGRPIVREAFMNRSSYRCPRCQRTPRRPHP